MGRRRFKAKTLAAEPEAAPCLAAPAFGRRQRLAVAAYGDGCYRLAAAAYGRDYCSSPYAATAKRGIVAVPATAKRDGRHGRPAHETLAAARRRV